MKLKCSFLLLFLLFATSFFNGCTQKYSNYQSISWNENTVYYQLTSEEVNVGQLLYLELYFNKSEDIQARLTTKTGEGPSATLLRYYNTDSKQTKALAEIVYDTPGEKILNNLAITFTNSKMENHIIPLETMVIEVHSLLPAEAKNDPITLASLVSPLHPITNPTAAILIIITITLFLIFILFSISMVMKIKKRKSDTKNFKKFFKKSQKVLQELNFSDEKSLISLYNFVNEAKKFQFQQLQLNNCQIPENLIKFIEKILFSKEKIEISTVQESQFRLKFENWIQILEKEVHHA